MTIIFIMGYGFGFGFFFVGGGGFEFFRVMDFFENLTKGIKFLFKIGS